MQIAPAGSTRARLYHAMMVKNHAANTRAIKQHLCYVGIKPPILAKYKIAARRFMYYLNFVGRRYPVTLHEFDDAAAEFIIF